MRQGCLLIACLIFLILLSSCSPSKILLSPPPSRIERIEGHASLRITGEEGSARSKFSFLFCLPHQGRIEASDFLGRSLYQIIIDEQNAFFIVPSKKVYWQGEEDEVIQRFLGFRLTLEEMISLVSGVWEEAENRGEGEKKMEEWFLEKDEKGRIWAGQRGMLRVEIKEFIEDTSFAQVLVFEHPLTLGRVKILSLGLNRPLNKEAFNITGLKRFERMTWAEIQEIIENED